MKNIFKIFIDQALKKIASFIINHIWAILVTAGFGVAFWVGLIQSIYEYLNLEIPLGILIISLVLLGLSLYVIDKFRNPEKPKIETLNIGGVCWRLSIYKNGKFKMDELPYCSVHGAQYYEALGSYQCPNTNCTSKKIFISDIGMAYRSAKSVSQGHVRGEIKP